MTTIEIQSLIQDFDTVKRDQRSQNKTIRSAHNGRLQAASLTMIAKASIGSAAFGLILSLFIALI